MKKKKYYLSFSLLLVFIICIFFYFTNSKTEKIINVTNNKEEIYTDIRDYIRTINTKEEDLDSLENGKKSIDDFISNKEKLVFFDSYNTEKDKRLAYETLISLSYIIEKDPAFPGKDDFKNIILKDNYASIPLSLFSPSLLGVDLDLFKEDGEWKIYMKNLVNYVRMAEFYHSERMLNENK